MKQIIFSLVLTTGVVLISGCQRSAPPVPRTITINAAPTYSIEVQKRNGAPIRLSATEPITVTPSGIMQGIVEGDGNVIIGDDNNKLDIRGGLVFANGNEGGQVKPGDSVLLDKDGRLFVNGQERTLNASPQKPIQPPNLDKGVTIAELNWTLREIGFTLGKATVTTNTLNINTVFLPDGTSKTTRSPIQSSRICKNAKTGASIEYREEDAAKYSLLFANDAAGREALIAFASKIGAKLSETCKDALTAFDKDQKEGNRLVGKVSVTTSKRGIAIESVPPPSPPPARGGFGRIVPEMDFHGMKIRAVIGEEKPGSVTFGAVSTGPEGEPIITLGGKEIIVQKQQILFDGVTKAKIPAGTKTIRAFMRGAEVVVEMDGKEAFKLGP